MSSSPYDGLPDYAYWKLAVSNLSPRDLEPVNAAFFRISRNDRIVTAGSCFAEHIGRHLKAAGCNFLVTEPAHPLLSKNAARIANYGRFSARYGNIYTPRQLLQLFDRAYASFVPAEDVWQESSNIFLDPFRPNIQPKGFNSPRELALDRNQHLTAVREAFDTLDVFIFTLGLTECWRSRIDGAVFPLCPGARGGQFSRELHEFVNFDVDDVVKDIRDFIERLRSVNPKSKVILTVSPVPLAATAENRHVLVSTIYSKSVLRVACEKITRSLQDVCYFPAYEIITSPNSNYYEEDRRNVTEAGVTHVMRVFYSHFLDNSPLATKGEIIQKLHRRMFGNRSSDQAELKSAFEVMCDEEALLLPKSKEKDLTSQKA